MLLRERETAEGRLVSVCDPTASAKRTTTDVRRSPSARSSTAATTRSVEATAEEVVAGLHRAQVANIVGTEAVGVAVEAGLVDEETVLEFDETRHAQLLWL